MSGIAVVVFWGLSAAAPWVKLLQGPGKPNVIVAAAIAAYVTLLFLLLVRRHERREDEKLRREREELRKDTETLMRLAAAIISRHDVPVQAAPLLTVVQESLLRESA